MPLPTPAEPVFDAAMATRLERIWNKAYAAMEPILTEAFAQQNVTLLGGYRYPQQVLIEIGGHQS